MLRDISYDKATLQSEGKLSIHFTAQYFTINMSNNVIHGILHSCYLHIDRGLHTCTSKLKTVCIPTGIVCTSLICTMKGQLSSMITP